MLTVMKSNDLFLVNSIKLIKKPVVKDMILYILSWIRI